MDSTCTKRENSEGQARSVDVISTLEKWLPRAVLACECILQWALKLQPLAAGFARAKEEHRARCYAAHFKKEDLAPAEAEILGVLVPRLGVQFQKRRSLIRSAGQLLRPLACARTTLVISRQAQLLSELCERGGEIGEALYGAGLTQSREELRSLLKAASERDANACYRLQQAGAKGYRRLPKSRGRQLTLESATHAVFLAILKEEGKRWGYTDHQYRVCFSDARTAATSEAFKLYRSS
jgi:hypothetical protein